jgi:NAD/NADP transhydrogenase beta subunit
MLEFIKDLFHFIAERKKWWLVPMIIILILMGVLIVFSSGSAIAPFIYTLF